MNYSAMQRLAKEYLELKEDPLEGFLVNLGNQDDLFLWKVTVFGPPDTIYQGGYFKAHIKFTNDYPFEPPSVKFLCNMWHPNISETGEVAMSILNKGSSDESWRPVFGVYSILTNIASLLNEPNTIRTNIVNHDAFETYTAWKLGDNDLHKALIEYDVAESTAEAEIDGEVIEQCYSRPQVLDNITLDCSDSEETTKEFDEQMDTDVSEKPSIADMDQANDKDNSPNATIREPDAAVESLNNSVQQCSIQPDTPGKSCVKPTMEEEKMETEEDHQVENMETDNVESEKQSRPKQNPEILPATTPLPIKKEEKEKKPKLHDSSSDSDESDDTASESFQKAIASDAWEKEMQQKINEAISSKDKPTPIDRRFVKKSLQDNKGDESKKDESKKDESKKGKSKRGKPKKKASKEDEGNTSDISLDEDEFENIIKDLESKEADELTPEMKIQLAEAQEAKKVKLENYITKQKKIKKKNQSEKQDPAPGTPNKRENRKDSANTPKTSKSGK